VLYFIIFAMNFKNFLIEFIFLLVLLVGCGIPSMDVALSNDGNLSIQEGERIVVFAPHPDDEVIGCAGIIQECLAKNGEVYIVFLTNGDHNQFAFKAYTKRITLSPTDYIKLGEVRRKESIKADEILGVPTKNLIFLGYPDSGTLTIWKDYWNSKKPFTNSFTRRNFVPYPDNPSYGEGYFPQSIEKDIQNILIRIKPSKIFVTHPADQNPDHRALFNFTYLALLDCKNTEHPEIYCYLVHSKRWPKPRGLFPDNTIEPPSDQIQNKNWFSFRLSAIQENNKFLALDCFRSQLIGRKNWTFSFLRTNEIFDTVSLVPYENKKIPEISIEAKSQEEIMEEESLKHSKVYNLRLSSDADNIIFNLSFDRKVLEKKFGVKIYLYPWKKDVPFALMPKILVDLRLDGSISIFDNGKTISTRGILANKSNNDYVFKFPVGLLNNPNALFIGGETKISNLTLDFFPWMVIQI